MCFFFLVVHDADHDERADDTFLFSSTGSNPPECIAWRWMKMYTVWLRILEIVIVARPADAQNVLMTQEFKWGKNRKDPFDLIVIVWSSLEPR